MANCPCASDRPYKIRTQMFGFFMPVTCIKNQKLAVVNQGPRQPDDQMSGKRVRGIRCLKTTLVARSDRQCANTCIVRGQN